MRIATTLPLLALTMTLVGAATTAERADAVEPRETRVKSPDGFELVASYFAPDRPGPGILLLHQCNADRSMWNDLGSQLADAGVHVLAIDYRGSGNSTGPRARQLDGLDSTARAEVHAADVAAALDALRSMQGVDASRIATGGASCGGPRSIYLAAEAGGVRAMLFLSTFLGKPAIERFERSLADVPVLVVTAENDGQTTSSRAELFARARHRDSRTILYKGDAHGYPLFDQDPDLERVIKRWVLRMLR